MEIVYPRRCCKTGRLLEELMPDVLGDEQVLLNLGCGGFDEDGYEDYLIINNKEAVNNCADKKRMFGILKINCVPCLEYYDLQKLGGLAASYELLLKGGKLLLRSPAYRDYSLMSKDNDYRDYAIPYPARYTYATKLENKINEWRVICFKGQVMRIWRKEPFAPMQLFWHREDCEFRKVINEQVGQLALEAANALGIDLCGVDILENDKNELKVIEVNSGLSMSEITIRRLYRRICGLIGIEEDYYE
jgi:hypothetical protein